MKVPSYHFIDKKVIGLRGLQMAQSPPFPVSIEIVSDRKKMQAHLPASVRQHVGWQGSWSVWLRTQNREDLVHLDLAVRTQHLAS